MGVFLRVFDPKGYRNPYKGSTDWREIGRERVEPIEELRPHHIREELHAQQEAPTYAPDQAWVKPSEPGAQEPESKEGGQVKDPQETTIERAETPSDLEVEMTNKREFYGPGELTGIAGDLMNKDFPTLKDTAHVIEASKLLKDRRFNYLPVVSEKGSICGLITEDHIFRQLIDQETTREELDKTEVKEVMISPVLCCLIETPLAILIQTILDEKVGLLPVVDSHDNLKGIVTKNNLLRYIFDSSHFFD